MPSKPPESARASLTTAGTKTDSLIVPDLARTFDPERLLSFAEGCNLLGIRERKTWEMVNTGELPHLRVGRLIRFRRASLIAWIDRAERKAARP